MAEHSARSLTAKHHYKDKNITPAMFYYWRKKDVHMGYHTT